VSYSPNQQPEEMRALNIKAVMSAHSLSAGMLRARQLWLSVVSHMCKFYSVIFANFFHNSFLSYLCVSRLLLPVHPYI